MRASGRGEAARVREGQDPPARWALRVKVLLRSRGAFSVILAAIRMGFQLF